MEWSLLAGLPSEEREGLLARAGRKTYERNEVVFHEGETADSLYLIAKGKVAVKVTTPLGDNATLAVLGPGDFFGEMSLVSPPPARSATIAALEPTEAVIIHRDVFTELRERHPAMNALLVEALSSEVRRLTDHLLEALFVPVQTRIFRRLVVLAEVYASGDNAPIIPLSQDDIAALAGTTRPTVNSVLKTAEKSGILALSRNHIELVDLDELRRRARP